ncbi:hypothetical protein HYZ99_04395, partial [Candidatus Peregrinibacteria bacterium]|nr:hypothetical protein [Candidatus Peregrinibacteria bacterium]
MNKSLPLDRSDMPSDDSENRIIVPRNKWIVTDQNLMTRRKFLEVSLATAAAAGIAWDESFATEGVDREHVLKLKHEALKKNRPQVQKFLDLRKESLEKIVGKERAAEIFRVLKKYFGCIDEGLQIENMHKIGIAGLGADMTQEESDL